MVYIVLGINTKILKNKYGTIFSNVLWEQYKLDDYNNTNSLFLTKKFCVSMKLLLIFALLIV